MEHGEYLPWSTGAGCSVGHFAMWLCRSAGRSMRVIALRLIVVLVALVTMRDLCDSTGNSPRVSVFCRLFLGWMEVCGSDLRRDYNIRWAEVCWIGVYVA